MIIDSFIFYNELELLDLRLRILSDCVDYFLIVESDTTFSNKPKPLFYEENKQLFEEFGHKIISTSFSSNKQSFTRNNVHDQRNYIYDSIVENFDLNDDDVIILSDLDEIPNPNVIVEYQSNNKQNICSLDAKMFYYYLNTRVNYDWKAIKIFRAKDLKKDLHSLRISTEHTEILPNGGWHWSFVGGVELMKQKLSAFSHQELNTPEVINSLPERMKNLNEPFLRDAKLWRVDIDDSFPKYIIDNQELLKEKNWII